MAEINIDELFKTPSFASLSEEQKELYKQTFDRIKGKSFAEAVVVIMDMAKKMPKGTEMTVAEKRVMIEAFIESAPLVDRGKYRKMAEMFMGK